MELFPSLKKSLESEELSRGDSPIKPKFSQVEYRLQNILYKLDKVNDLSDDEILDIIKNQYRIILNYDFFLIDNSRSILQKLFTNRRFLQIFSDNVGCISLAKHEIICINKLAYDYYVLEDKDKDIQDLLLQISYKINTKLVIILSAKLGMNNARALSMIANSSFKINKNIHRMNVFLNRCSMELSVAEICEIMSILFGNNFTQLFIYTMLEVPEGEEPTQRFQDISSALLELLNSLTTEDIKTVLYNYKYIVQSWNIKNVRFSLKLLVGYDRITQAVYDVDNIDMPIP